MGPATRRRAAAIAAACLLVACGESGARQTMAATGPSVSLEVRYDSHAGRICTQIYGGPETIRVTGRIGKAVVRRTFKRTNGCEISDFARVARALPIVP